MFPGRAARHRGRRSAGRHRHGGGTADGLGGGNPGGDGDRRCGLRGGGARGLCRRRRHCRTPAGNRPDGGLLAGPGHHAGLTADRRFLRRCSRHLGGAGVRTAGRGDPRGELAGAEAPSWRFDCDGLNGRAPWDPGRSIWKADPSVPVGGRPARWTMIAAHAALRDPRSGRAASRPAPARAGAVGAHERRCGPHCADLHGPRYSGMDLRAPRLHAPGRAVLPRAGGGQGLGPRQRLKLGGARGRARGARAGGHDGHQLPAGIAGGDRLLASP